MKATDLLEKLNKLNRIYGTMNAEIEAYDVEIRVSIWENWQKKKVKIQLNLINQFKTDACLDIASKAWLQALSKMNDPLKKPGFKKWYEKYIKNN